MDDSPEEIARLPLRPMYGTSTAHPARKAAGMHIALIITCCFRKKMNAEPIFVENTYVAIGDIERSVSEDGTTALQPLQTVRGIVYELHFHSQVREKTVV